MRLRQGCLLLRLEAHGRFGQFGSFFLDRFLVTLFARPVPWPLLTALHGASCSFPDIAVSFPGKVDTFSCSHESFIEFR